MTVDKDNVVLFPGVASISDDDAGLSFDALFSRIPKDIDTLMVLGVTKDGGRYFLSTNPSGPEMLWILEDSKQIVMNLVRKS